MSGCRETEPRKARRRWVAALLLVVVAVSAAITFRKQLFEHNFGIVDAGLVYRCEQPEENLTALVRTYGLRSVVNLRGGSPADAFYATETRLAVQEGVVFYDLPMIATRRPTRRELLALIDLYERGPYPLLIHCKSGSDRTGLASVLYLMVRRGEPYSRARREFTIRHGHVNAFGTEHLHEPFEEYESWLKGRGLPHTPERLRSWVAQEYRSPVGGLEFSPLRPGPRPVSSKGGGEGTKAEKGGHVAGGATGPTKR